MGAESGRTIYHDRVARPPGPVRAVACPAFLDAELCVYPIRTSQQSQSREAYHRKLAWVRSTQHQPRLGDQFVLYDGYGLGNVLLMNAPRIIVYVLNGVNCVG